MTEVYLFAGFMVACFTLILHYALLTRDLSKARVTYTDKGSN